jgi:hypothetical protein
VNRMIPAADWETALSAALRHEGSNYPPVAAMSEQSDPDIDRRMLERLLHDYQAGRIYTQPTIDKLMAWRDRRPQVPFCDYADIG